MKTINLSDLKNYNEQLIYEYLSGYSGSTFMIKIPRQHPSESDNIIISCEYVAAAYAGQLLKDISINFGMFIPDPYSDDDFCFKIVCSNRKALVSILCLFEAGFLQENEAMVNFQVKAAQFFQDAFDGKVGSNCWDLLFIANGMLQND